MDADDLMFAFAMESNPRHSRWCRDAAYVSPRLIALATGGASLPSPGLASVVAIEALEALGADTNVRDPMARLRKGIEHVVETLRSLTDSDSAWRTTGTSLTALLCAGGRIAVAHIGICRVFLVRGDRKYQITHDHTLGQFLIDEGLATVDEVAENPDRFALTRWLDGYNEPDFEYLSHEVKAGDRFFLCTDGFWKTVPMAFIEKPLCESQDPSHAVGELISLKEQHDSRRDATCIVADVIPYISTDQLG